MAPAPITAAFSVIPASLALAPTNADITKDDRARPDGGALSHRYLAHRPVGVSFGQAVRRYGAWNAIVESSKGAVPL